MYINVQIYIYIYIHVTYIRICIYTSVNLSRGAGQLSCDEAWESLLGSMGGRRSPERPKLQEELQPGLRAETGE